MKVDDRTDGSDWRQLEEADEAILEPGRFPFKCTLSLNPLVEFWKRELRTGQSVLQGLCPDDFHRQLDDLSDIGLASPGEGETGGERSSIHTLMAAVFPPTTWKTDLAFVMPPFGFRPVYASPSFARISARASTPAKSNVDSQTEFSLRLLFAYSLILREFYDIRLEVDYPIVRTAIDPDTGLPRFFKAEVDPQFIRIKRIGEPKELSADQIARLKSNLTNLQLLKELIPPSDFEFEGFVPVRVIDVTDQEILSAIKRLLIERGSIVCQEAFSGLQDRLRALLRCSDLSLSLSALKGNEVLFLNAGVEIRKNCIFHDTKHLDRSRFCGSMFERAVAQRVTQVVEDLDKYPSENKIDRELLEYGFKNVVVAPLVLGDEVVGTLGLASPNVGDLNSVNSMKLREVLPLFAVAIKRSMDELDNQVEALIKQKCTAIHPSVEWRFRRAALNFMVQAGGDQAADMEPIHFKDVYPLYGISDIRRSSDIRNEAISDDLEAQLTDALSIVEQAKRLKPMPILDEQAFRVNRLLTRIGQGLHAEDEFRISDYLVRELGPLLEVAQQFGSDLAGRIETYREALHPKLQTYFTRRQAYEESVSRINAVIGNLIEEEQARAQSMYPHYFEKHSTDGIDHSLYIGASLVEDPPFDPLYLRNLRLWQLILMSRIAAECARLKDDLPIPLELAHLIAVQDNPVSIRFRYDEREFAVDGAYNVRYEIIKKRIDKAVVKGRSERLTQPGKIAVVYSHSREAREYRHYLEFLHATGYLTADLEDLQLNDLQGVSGLKALRVTVDARSPQDSPPTREIEAVAQRAVAIST